MCLVFTLFILTVPVSFARQKGDWNTVKNSINQQIAVKTKDGKTTFGILRAADDSEIKFQAAGKKDISTQQTTVRRDELTGVWRATLRFGGRQIGKGALIGAGIGAGIGVAIFAGTAKDDDDGLAGAIIPLTAIYGAGIGAVAGIFSKKSHKKNELIYSS